MIHVFPIPAHTGIVALCWLIILLVKYSVVNSAISKSSSANSLVAGTSLSLQNFKVTSRSASWHTTSLLLCTRVHV